MQAGEGGRGAGEGSGVVGRVTSHAVADVCADKKAFKSYFDIINDS